MPTKELMKILSKYCDSIRFNSRHYVCYPTGSNSIITVSGTPSDRNRHKQVYREFRRAGIDIPELNKH